MARPTATVSPAGRPAAFHQILILLLGSMFFGGDGSEDLVARVENALPDGDARDRAVEIAGRIVGGQRDAIRGFLDSRARFYDAVARETLTESELRSRLAGPIAELRTLEQHTVDEYLQLRTTIDAEAWAELFPAPE